MTDYQAEIDHLRAWTAEQLMMLGHEHDARMEAEAEVDRLRAELAAARREAQSAREKAIEECAQQLERHARADQSVTHTAFNHLLAAANDLRALAEPKPGESHE